MDATRCRPVVIGRGIRLGFALGLVPLLTGASYRTQNFTVEAPSAEAAKRVGDHAESCRKAIAIAWLGRELPHWTQPCPVRVKLTGGEAGGITSFGFNGGRVSDQDISVEGRLDRILASALPHEITHTIFAAYFGGPMPRWADEGASLLSEDRRERVRHDGIIANVLARRRRHGAQGSLHAGRVSGRPDGVLRSGLLGVEVPGRDRRTAPVPEVRPGGDASGLGRRGPVALRSGQLPGTRPRLALLVHRRRPNPPRHRRRIGHPGRSAQSADEPAASR